MGCFKGVGVAKDKSSHPTGEGAKKKVRIKGEQHNTLKWASEDKIRAEDIANRKIQVQQLLTAMGLSTIQYSLWIYYT